MKTFNLSKNYNFTEDLQNNLKLLKNEFGTHFYIKTQKFKIPVILQLKTFNLNKKKYFQLQYDISRIEHDLYPFKIDFYNGAFDFNLGNKAYIAAIHNTDKISGSNMVLLVLEILKKLNTKQASLGDGTEIDCKDKKIDLSFLKLIEKKKGFYEKFGFKYNVNEDIYMVNYFSTNKKLYKYLYDSIDEFRKIKISYYKKLYIDIIHLISELIIKQDFENADIAVMNEDMQEEITFYYKKKEDNKKYLIELLSNINDTLELFKNSKQTLLYKLMIELFNDRENCDKYLKLVKNVINNRLYFIKYKRTKYIFDYLYLINLIYSIRRFGILTYDFY